MISEQKKHNQKRFYAAVGGVVLVAICCFTPLLVIILGAVGLSVFTPYLDYILLPALAILINVAFISYKRYIKANQNNFCYFTTIGFILDKH